MVSYTICRCAVRRIPGASTAVIGRPRTASGRARAAGARRPPRPRRTPRCAHPPPAARLDDDAALDAHTAPPREIDAGLDGEDHALLEHGGRARVEAGRFVGLQPQRVPGAMAEIGAVPA